VPSNGGSNKITALIAEFKYNIWKKKTVKRYIWTIYLKWNKFKMTILSPSVKHAGETLNNPNNLCFVRFVVQFIFTKDACHFDVGNGNATNAQ
jgi:hypothetical protein